MVRRPKSGVRKVSEFVRVDTRCTEEVDGVDEGEACASAVAKSSSVSARQYAITYVRTDVEFERPLGARLRAALLSLQVLD
jgi:hypothetical protein